MTFLPSIATHQLRNSLSSGRTISPQQPPQGRLAYTAFPRELTGGVIKNVLKTARLEFHALSDYSLSRPELPAFSTMATHMEPLSHQPHTRQLFYTLGTPCFLGPLNWDIYHLKNTQVHYGVSDLACVRQRARLARRPCWRRIQHPSIIPPKHSRMLAIPRLPKSN